MQRVAPLQTGDKLFLLWSSMKQEAYNALLSGASIVRHLREVYSHGTD